jgi:hypothetical protein
MYKTILFLIHFVFSWFNLFVSYTQVFSALFSIKMFLPWCSCSCFALMLCSFQLGLANETSKDMVVRSMILTERHCLTKHSLLISQAMKTFLVYNLPLIPFHQRIRIGFVST